MCVCVCVCACAKDLGAREKGEKGNKYLQRREKTGWDLGSTFTFVTFWPLVALLSTTRTPWTSSSMASSSGFFLAASDFCLAAFALLLLTGAIAVL